MFTVYECLSCPIRLPYSYVSVKSRDPTYCERLSDGGKGDATLFVASDVDMEYVVISTAPFSCTLSPYCFVRKVTIPSSGRSS